jgi:hypothetical protein
VSEWVGEYRRFWDESFERLDEYLEQLKREKESNGRQEDGR